MSSGPIVIDVLLNRKKKKRKTKHVLKQPAPQKSKKTPKVYAAHARLAPSPPSRMDSKRARCSTKSAS